MHPIGIPCIQHNNLPVQPLHIPSSCTISYTPSPTHHVLHRYEEACRLPFTLDHDGDDQGVNPLHSHTHSPTPHQPAAALVPSVSHGGKSDDNVHGDSDDGDAAADDDHDDNDDGGGLAPWQQVAARVQR